MFFVAEEKVEAMQRRMWEYQRWTSVSLKWRYIKTQGCKISCRSRVARFALHQSCRPLSLCVYATSLSDTSHSYHIACLQAVSGFTQTFVKLNDWKGNFQSSRFVARRVNPRCSHSFSALWRNGRKMGKETSSEGAGRKKDATKGGGMFSCLCR